MEESNSKVASSALVREHAEPKAMEEWSAGEQFQLALEAAPIGMIITDPRGRIVLTNAQVERLFGYGLTELAGKSIEVLVPERLHQDHAKYRRNSFRNPQARLMGVGRDLYGRRKDGTEVAVEIGLNPVETPDWNSGVEQLKGYQAGEIIGKNFSCFYTREQIDRGQPQHELKLATEVGRFEDEGWRLRKDGSAFWASLVITPVRDRRNELIGFTKVTRDLTARKRARAVQAGN